MATRKPSGRSNASFGADVATRWNALTTADRRVLRRLAQFEGVFPEEALVAFADGSRGGTLERLLACEAVRRDEDGFRIAPAFARLARSMPGALRARAVDRAAFGRWLLEHIATVEQSAAHTARAFDRLEAIVGDVRRVVGELVERQPELSAKLWCAIADLLFYRRLLPFDSPEYDIACRCADVTQNHALRVHARIAAGRAVIEVKSPSHARGYFEEARRLASVHGLDDWEADAIRGLGWVVLAEGDVAGAEEHFLRARALHQASNHSRGIADACMALGTLNVLRSNLEEADQLLFRAEAMLRARHDTVRLAKLGTLRQTLGLATHGLASVEVDLHGLLARGQYWRGALLLFRSTEPAAKRRAEVLADLAGVSWRGLMAREPTPTWELRCDGRRRMLVGPDGTSHDLTRRGPLVKVLEALSCSAGALSAVSLFEAAWPAERVRHEAALSRVYTTVRRLRSLGVPIETSGDGYFCDQIRSTP